MDKEIKITAHLDPSRPETCKFAVNRTVYQGGWASFTDKEKAKGSPLAEKLFGIENVTAVRISEKTVTVSKSDFEEWRPVAKKVGAVIREHLLSGQPAVSEKHSVKLLSDQDLKFKVQEVIDVMINPAVASHGGVIELIDVKDNKVYLRLGGGCQGCGMANVTLRQGIEGALQDKVPQVDEILDVTDHASGQNPYYAPSKK